MKTSQNLWLADVTEIALELVATNLQTRYISHNSKQGKGPSNRRFEMDSKFSLSFLYQFKYIYSLIPFPKTSMFIRLYV